MPAGDGLFLRFHLFDLGIAEAKLLWQFLPAVAAGLALAAVEKALAVGAVHREAFPLDATKASSVQRT